jgi:bacterioferritin
MEYSKAIEKLNEALRHEWTGVAQYSQAGFLVSGVWREVYADKFFDDAKESFGHARDVGEKIVALGGVPTVERGQIKQTDNLEELLRNALEFEQKAVNLYTDAIKIAEDIGDRALVIFLENILEDEQEGVDEYAKILREPGAAVGGKKKASTKAG